MERVLTSGPELAKGPSMFPCTPAQDDDGAPRSAEVAARVRRALRRPGGGDLYPVAFYLAVAATLVATGYPARRIALVALAGVVLMVAVTGGVRSPLLITLIGAYTAASAVVGDRRQTRMLLAATAVAVGVLAALPRALTGPELPSSVFAVLAAVSVLGTGALLVPVHALIRMKRDEFVRQRSDIASDALARAESLEQIGSKLAHELKNPLTGVKALV